MTITSRDSGGHHGPHPQHDDGAEELHQPVSQEAHQAGGDQVGEGGQRDQVGGGREGVVEVGRAPGGRRRVDHVEEHHRDPDHDDRPPGDVAGPGLGLLRGRGAPQERAEADQQRHQGHQPGGLPRQSRRGQRERRADDAAHGPPAVEGRQDRPPVAMLQRHRLHVAGRVDHPEADAVRRQAGDQHPEGRREHQHRHPDRHQEQPEAQQPGAVVPLGRRSASTEPTPASSTIISSSPDRASSPRSQRSWSRGSRVVRLMKTRPWARNAAPTAVRARARVMARIVTDSPGGRDGGLAGPARRDRVEPRPQAHVHHGPAAHRGRRGDGAARCPASSRGSTSTWC